MFISQKRHEREIQELLSQGNRLSDALLKGSPEGLFLLDVRDRIQPQTSKSLGTMFRRQDFSNLSFEKLIGPVVSAKTLSAARGYVLRLLEGKLEADAENPLANVEVRLPDTHGGFTTAHYGFDFVAIETGAEPKGWLVRVSDVTTLAQEKRELEDLRNQVQSYGEILRAVLTSGGSRFGSFITKTDLAMKTINDVLKKPAREADAFRSKLEETLVEVDRMRRDAAALKLSSLESSARSFEDALQELRSRGNLSGSDFLPIAVKLDQLYSQFVTIRSLTTQATARQSAAEQAAPDVPMTAGGTQIIEAPKFMEQMALLEAARSAGGSPRVDAGEPLRRMAAVGSLDSTLATLTDMMAQEHGKTVVLESTGLDLVPPRYQATIKNVAIQLIRNAVMHGIEDPATREAAGKAAHGTLQLEFRAQSDGHFELMFQDDGRGLDPDHVRSTAVARGLLDQEEAARLRDRQAIKLIFKSAYTTLAPAIDGQPAHGTGMSLVRRYVHEAGGKIALASLLGHETRFKVSLPPAEADAAQVA